MTDSPLKFRISLSKLQRASAKYYLQLRQRFVANVLVSEMWGSMEQDLLAQAEGIKKLPSAFWMSLQKQEAELARAAESLYTRFSAEQGGALTACFSRTFELEEPVILSIYAPLIRRLRTNWTEVALDFYVLVRARIIKLARLIQTYAGDPALCQRCSVLLVNLDKEIQEPNKVEVSRKRQTSKKSAGHVKRPVKAAAGRSKLAAAEKSPARQRDRVAKRAKPLVKEIGISRRRARR
ncbi:MAG: hypothetical protein ABSC02_06430 [Acidobacteriota bacterium]|jgi:hypothetical protein